MVAEHKRQSGSVRVRALEERDLSEVARMLTLDMQNLGVNTPSDRLHDLVAHVFADGGKTSMCWVALVEAHRLPVGLILVNFYQSIKFGGPSIWIEGLYVDPDVRRHGIGRALVEHVLDWAEAREFLGVDLEAYHGNTPAAVLYRSLGFNRLGRERFSLCYEDGD